MPESKKEKKNAGEESEARTERESENKKWHTFWCCRARRRAYRIAQASAEKLERIAPAEQEKVVSAPQTEQLARSQMPPFREKKGGAISPNYKTVK